MSETQAAQGSNNSIAVTQDSPFRDGKVLVVYVLGGPGVGKGFQCQRLVEDFGFAHFSVGDLLREESNRPGSAFGSLIEQHMRQCTIVPAEIALTLMKRTMIEEMEKGHNIFIIDGFPRSMEQALLFESEICDSGVTLLFDCSPEVMLERVLDRGKTSQRIDDNEDAFWKRWNGYKSDTVPVLDYLRKKDINQVVTKIDCEGPLETGYTEIKRVVEDFIDRHLAVQKLSSRARVPVDSRSKNTSLE